MKKAGYLSIIPEVNSFKIEELEEEAAEKVSHKILNLNETKSDLNDTADLNETDYFN